MRKRSTALIAKTLILLNSSDDEVSNDGNSSISEEADAKESDNLRGLMDLSLASSPEKKTTSTEGKDACDVKDTRPRH